MSPWVKSGIIAAVIVLVMSRSATTSNTDGTYPVDPDKPYGRVFRTNLPPGLPENARLCEAADSDYGIRALERELHRYHDNALSVGVIALAEKETHTKLGKPTEVFNALHDAGQRYTAWGMFQYTESTWEGLWEAHDYLGGVAAATGPMQHHAWDATPEQEVAFPVRRYALLVDYLRSTGRRDPTGLAMSIWVLNRGSGVLRSWLDAWSPGSDATQAWHDWDGGPAESWKDRHSNLPNELRVG